MISCRIQGREQQIDSGIPIGRLLPPSIDGHPVVAALLDKKPVSLTTPIICDAEIEPLTTAHWEGLRIFRSSLGLLLLEAAARLDPTLDVRLGPSLGFARRVEVAPHAAWPAAKLAPALEAKMNELIDAGVTLIEEQRGVEFARQQLARAGWIEAADLLRISRERDITLVSYGTVYAPRLAPLLPDARPLGGFRLFPNGKGMLLVYPKKAAPHGAAEELTITSGREASPAASAIAAQTEGMTRSPERWLAALGITSVAGLNQASIDGDVSQLIRVNEGFHEKMIGEIADRITNRVGELGMVTIAGPSSAGKTTFIKRLTVQLLVNGVRPVGLSIDDYYVDREKTPRDENGDYDFESIDAIDLDLLRQHLSELMNGNSVKTARFDFLLGKSIPDGGPEIRIDERSIIMLEGIHGLNPHISDSIAASKVARIFVCPLVQLPFDRLSRIHASDVRLLRRIVRDRHHRGHNAAETIMRWPSVRAGERRHIYPFQSHADFVFDSSLIYELCVLKVYAERYLLEVPHDHPAYTTAFRLLRLIDHFVAIYPDHVPPTSILREFIGESGFEY